MADALCQWTADHSVAARYLVSLSIVHTYTVNRVIFDLRRYTGNVWIYISACLTTVLSMYLLVYRGYMTYFEIQWNLAMDNSQWRLSIDPDEAKLSADFLHFHFSLNGRIDQNCSSMSTLNQLVLGE